VSDNLQELHSSAERLERYAHCFREHICVENRTNLSDALTDTAETSEITRRLTSSPSLLHA
jgi:hypothetical protein